MRSFVLRVQDDDATRGRALARALVEPIGARGMRVRLDGVAHDAPGSQREDGPTVHLATTSRGLRGTSVRIGLFDADRGARWLAPLDVPDEPADAVRTVVDFLAQWGFIGAASGPAAPRAPPP